MDSALGCGHEWVEKFNAFQTSYGPELRRSDRTLLTLFKRIYGPSRGDAAYNLFKTNMASKAEIKRVHNSRDFCASADLVFAAPTLLGSAAIAASARDNQLFAESRSTTIQAQRAANLEKESQHLKAAVVSTTKQPKEASHATVGLPRPLRE